MSFQASHLLFAQKVQNIIKPQDLTRYFSGSIYPDSRFITGADRGKTHPAVMEPQKIKDVADDFEKGWQIHLWYDKVAILPLYQIATDRPYNLDELQKREVWILVTGAKLVEDLYCWQTIDWPKMLPHLKQTANPNDESLEILNNWYRYYVQFFQNMPNIEAYRDQAKFVNIPETEIEQILASGQNLYKDKIKRFKIEKIITEVFEEFTKLCN